MGFDKFKTFTLRWWQGSIFKITMLSLGIIIGATWPEALAPWRVAFGAAWILGSAYLTMVWWKQ